MNAVYMYYTPSWQPLADIVLPSAERYCEKHVYDLFIRDSEQNDNWALHKMENLLWYLKIISYEDSLIWVLDLDALITNKNIPFDCFVCDSYHDIFITKDVNGINAGSWIMRNTEASRNFLKKIVENFDAPHEQILMNKYLHMVKVKYLPHPSINSYKYELYKDFGIETNVSHDQGQWQPGDLLLHLPGLSLEKRIEIFKEMI